MAEPTYSIGAVAERFGIAISTLRWWEKQGLVTPCGRQAGKRRYNQAGLRRIALIQLWQSTATMSLDEIGAVLAGNTRDQNWREAVHGRIARCDQQLARLTSARSYLSHLLDCPSDHPAEQCPYLASEIDDLLAALDPPQ
jgi:DNA-binding transcriptional MerR regulator